MYSEKPVYPKNFLRSKGHVVMVHDLLFPRHYSFLLSHASLFLSSPFTRFSFRISFSYLSLRPHRRCFFSSFVVPSIFLRIKFIHWTRSISAWNILTENSRAPRKEKEKKRAKKELEGRNSGETDRGNRETFAYRDW